jgi:chromate reductase
MAQTIHLIGIAGSLRRKSYNRAALRAAADMMPENADLSIVDWNDVPSFNQDRESHPPEKVVELKQIVRASDGVIFATPEYNFSIPGVLKNAIDWVSRPYGDSAWDDKPAAVMGASISGLGTARAQYHLRQILVGLNMYPINRPEVMISDAASKFDDNGNLVDETTRLQIKALVDSLVDWTERLQRARLVSISDGGK